MRAALIILFMITIRTLSASQPCKSELSVELKDRKYNGVTYNDGEYFVDENGVERGCICMKGICSRKCCPFGQVYDAQEFECVNSSKPFNPPVWTDYEEVKGFNASKEFQFMIGKQKCNEELMEERIFMHPFVKGYRLLTDGMLYLDIPDKERQLEFTIRGPDKFCLDTFINDLEPLGPDGTVLNALVCIVQSTDDNYYNVVLCTCMLISCFCILLTVGVYAWLPELRNLHGMVLMAYLISLFFAFLSLTTMKITTLMDQNTAIICVVLSFIYYFFLLVAFFWLNVMCYDIWYTFSGKRGPTNRTSVRACFLKYCAYSFGMPTLLTVILAALEFSDPPYWVPMMPRLRRNGCFLMGYSKLLYLYGPITVIIVMNFIFFMQTVFEIAKIKKQTAQMLKSNDSTRHDQHKKDKQRLSLYTKLFVVMGFNWVLQVISLLFPELEKFWLLTDSYNTLIGLTIFIINVCKKKILLQLKNRCKEFFRGATTVEMTDNRNKNIPRWQINQRKRGTIESTLSNEDADKQDVETHET